MLGDNVKESEMKFQPYLPDHKAGYYELEQLKPGIVICPFCEQLIDIKKNQQFKATVETIQVLKGTSWCSTPACRCPGIWAVYDPHSGKWAFRYKSRR